MRPIQLSAQYAAYVWFMEAVLRNPDDAAPQGRVTHALRFARRHWRLFLPCASPGLGKLLRKIGQFGQYAGTTTEVHHAS